jgi:hypothetical protein
MPSNSGSDYMCWQRWWQMHQSCSAGLCARNLFISSSIYLHCRRCRLVSAKACGCRHGKLVRRGWQPEDLRCANGRHAPLRPSWLGSAISHRSQTTKGEEKKIRNVRLDQVTMLTSNPNITYSNHFHGNVAILRSRSYTHTHTHNKYGNSFFREWQKKVNFSWDFYYENWQLFDMFS